MQNKSWQNTPLEVRDDYGENFFTDFKSAFDKSTLRARDPQEVVDAMTDAVMNVEPQMRYRCCGIPVAVIWRLNEHLPDKPCDDFWQFISDITF